MHNPHEVQISIVSLDTILQIIGNLQLATFERILKTKLLIQSLKKYYLSQENIYS